MEKVIATFNNAEKTEKALLELKNNQNFNGVTVITNSSTPMSKTPETRPMEPLDNLSNIANQVIDTASTAGRLVGSISGMAAVGLFSLPMMVMTPFMQGQNDSNYYTDPVEKQKSKVSEKQIVTVMGDSDLAIAKDILVNNGAKIIRNDGLL